MATPTSAWASAGASLVPSPVMATSLPLACSARMRRSFSSGVASARKSSTPASSAMAAAVRGLSPVIITVRMPMARKRSKRSRMPPLTTSFRWTMPSTRAPSATASGVPPDCAMRGRRPRRARPGIDAAQRLDVTLRPRPPRPCGSSRPSRSQPLMRVCAVKGTKWRGVAVRSRPRRPKRSLASTTIERPSGVSSARLASWAASASSSTFTPARG